MSPAVTIHHNLAPRRFVWLWMKYVTGVDNAHHCTNVLRVLRGRYSTKRTKHRSGVEDQGSGISEQGAGSK